MRDVSWLKRRENLRFQKHSGARHAWGRSISNHNGDGKENVLKSTVWIRKTTNSAHFLAHFSAVPLHGCDAPNFKFYGWLTAHGKHCTWLLFSLSFLNFCHAPWEFNLSTKNLLKISQIERDWIIVVRFELRNHTWPFQRRFYCRQRRSCLTAPCFLSNRSAGLTTGP